MPKLTDRFLAGLKVEPGRKDRMVFDSVSPGLGVRLTAKGTRTFICQWTDPATRRKVREPIGVWGNITIDKAREAVQIRLGEVAKGVDPKAERMRRRAEAERAEAALTFQALMEEWTALHLAHRRPRYAAEAVRAIRRGLPDLIRRPAVQISRADAVNALDQIVKSGKAITAGRTMAYARACFAWGKRRATVPENPFANLPISAGTTERERVLSDTEVAEVWAAADRLAYPFGPFFKLAILTLQRREEVAGMRWSEVADDMSHWTLPGSRMKNGRPHDVHLSEAARAILRALPRVDGCDFVFSTTSQRATAAEAELKGNRRREPTPISGFSQGKRYLDAAIEKARAEAAVETGRKPSTRVPWRLHDLRRTGVTTLAALGFDSIVVDKLLAHQPAKLRGVAGVYQRHDFARERASALEAWAAHILGVGASNVVRLQDGRRAARR
ncbi:MAG TPA: tyrosine-type recombinase/integrase [Stellaceae bacterium]|jgi:integrase|nr:tyrosine-type recombinase/integrase [Stellaceae bacterium]